MTPFCLHFVNGGVAVFWLAQRNKPLTAILKFIIFILHCNYFKNVLWVFVENLGSDGIRTHNYCEIGWLIQHRNHLATEALIISVS